MIFLMRTALSLFALAGSLAGLCRLRAENRAGAGRDGAAVPGVHRSRRCRRRWPAAPRCLVTSARWRFLQAGDLRNAEREIAAAMKLAPGFYPAEASRGYVDLARKDPKAALGSFDRALELQGNYPSALVGRGQALVALGREPEAIAAFGAALAVDPSLTDLQRRIEVLRFRGLERDLAAARAAARADRPDEARRAYQAAIASSPDSAFLYRELGGRGARAGAADAALGYFRKAVELDPSDAASWAQIGELLEARGDQQGALAAYDEALRLEPSDAVEARRDALVARAGAREAARRSIAPSTRQRRSREAISPRSSACG